MDAIGRSVPNDCSDLEAFDRGERDAGRRLYERHAALIYSLCREETGVRSHEDAEDALQETFLRAFRMLDRLTDCRGFRQWLCSIARLVCKERRSARAKARRDIGYATGQARATTREGAIPMQPPLSTHAADRALAAASESPSRPIERREILSQLGRAIDELPDDIRLALHIFYLEPEPVVAAKHALGVSRAQFYRLVSQARDQIGAKFSREDLQS